MTLFIKKQRNKILINQTDVIVHVYSHNITTKVQTFEITYFINIYAFMFLIFSYIQMIFTHGTAELFP